MSHALLFIAAITAAAPAPAAGPQLLGAVQAAAPAPAAPPAKPLTRADMVRDTAANFQEIDTDKDGSWSKAEIDAAQTRAEQRATAALGQRMSEEFTKLDTDKNGQLTLAEFRAGAPAIRAKPGASTAAIQRLDSNKDGKVSVDEYRAPLLAGFDRVDANKDGTVSADERNKAETASRTASSR